MNTLQRYVLKEIIGPTGLGLLVFTFVFLVGQMFKLADRLLNSAIPTALAGELILLILPSVLAVTIPMAVLVGVLLGVGRLAADREILAMRASGISLFHLAKPVIGFTILLSGLMIWGNMRLIPYLNLKSADLQVQVLFQSLSGIPTGLPNPIPTKDTNSTIFIDSKEPGTGRMLGVTILSQMEADQQMTNPEDAKTTANKAKRKEAKRLQKIKLEATSKKKDQLSKKEKLLELRLEQEQKWDDLVNKPVQDVLIFAESGMFDPQISERVVYVRLTSGTIHLTDPKDKGAYDIIKFDTLTKGIVPDFDKIEKGYFEKAPREMTTGELREQIKTRDKGRKYSVELYQRFSVPLACIAFGLIALPLAVYVRPTGKAVAFAISFLLILFYYGLLEYGVALGHANSPLGPVAIFLPNLIIASIGSFMLYRMVMK